MKKKTLISKKKKTYIFQGFLKKRYLRHFVIKLAEHNACYKKISFLIKKPLSVEVYARCAKEIRLQEALQRLYPAFAIVWNFEPTKKIPDMTD